VSINSGTGLYVSNKGGRGLGYVESIAVIHFITSVFDQILNLQNCFTTPNKNLGGEEASDR
jgi:hypothetical protein